MPEGAFHDLKRRADWQWLGYSKAAATASSAESRTRAKFESSRRLRAAKKFPRLKLAKAAAKSKSLRDRESCF